MSERPIEELRAGDEFRLGLMNLADSWVGSAPLWHGWAIMDAFLAGIDYQKATEAATEPEAGKATIAPEK